MSNPGAQLNSAVKTGAGRRRYISNRYGQTLIAWKLFSPWSAVWTGLAIWLVMFANNSLKLRWRIAAWDLAALRQCLARLPAIFAFRAANRELIQRHPGEKFFLQPEFALPPSSF